MTTNKKLLIAIACLSIVLIALVSTIAIVLVTSEQYATSGVNMSYKATDVKVDVSAKYYVDGSATNMTTSSGATTLSITPDSRSGSFLQPNGQIGMDSNFPNLVLEFIFQYPNDAVYEAKATITSYLDVSTVFSVDFYCNSSIIWYNPAHDTFPFTTADVLDISEPINLHPGPSGMAYVYMVVEVDSSKVTDAVTLTGSVHWEFSRSE